MMLMLPWRHETAAEIIDVTDTVLPASPTYVPYTKATVVGGPARAHISIANVVFHTTDYLPGGGNEKSDWGLDDESYDDATPPPIEVDDKMGDWDPTTTTDDKSKTNDGTSQPGSDNSNPTDASGGTATNDTTSAGDASNRTHTNATNSDGEGDRQRRLDGDGGVDVSGGSVIDIALFQVPSSCAYSVDGCTWSDHGVGVLDDMGYVAWCCDRFAVEAGLCQNTSAARDRLILTGNFTGFHETINVPPNGTMAKTASTGDFRIFDTGTWVLVFTNCKESGRDVVLTGSVVFESENGYLPGERFPYMYFSIALTVAYFLLFAWFACLMRRHADSRIPIEKWILLTIAIGLLEMSFQTADYVVWNDTGYQNFGIATVSILLGVLKHAQARCLFLMVSLGWGVTTDRLSKLTLSCIFILGAVYAGVGAALDISLIVAIENMKSMTYKDEMNLLGLAEQLESALYFVSFIFVFWTTIALTWTIMTLRNTNQTRKLGRYWRLTAVLLASYLCSAVVVYVAKSHNHDQRYEQLEDSATEAIFFMMLMGVSCLWRPNESAREYAYAMQLSSADVGNDLELTPVPSVADEPTSGYYTNGMDERFDIDDDGEALPRIT
jgi:Lung seven transmembrane receptor